MPMTIVCLLWIASFIGAILAHYGKLPGSVVLILVTLTGLLACLPLR